MLLTVLLICHASAEWVEISQQTYRKPLHPAKIQTSIFQPFATSTEAFVEARKKIEFINQTLTDKPWSKGTISRVSQVGIVKRVHGESVRNKTKVLSDVTKTPVIQDSASVETEEDKLSVKLNLFEQNVVTPYSEENLHINKKSTYKRNPFVTVNIESTPAEQYYFTLNEEKYDLPIIYSSEETSTLNAQSPFIFKTKTPTKPKEDHHDAPIPSSQFETKSKVTKTPTESNGSIKAPEDIDIGPDTLHHVNDTTTNKPAKKGKDPNQSHAKPKAESSKVNAMQNVIKILKIVSNTIAQNTKQSFESKLTYLHNMKNTLMANIESHINATWPDDSHRSARAVATSRSHVDFPSSESALMTISFLTFAVFLIKLVLQVIQKYKNPSVMTSAVVTTLRRATLAASPPEPDITYD